MSVSIEGAVKAAVVASGVVSGRVFQAGKVPEKPTFPYVTFTGPLADAIALEGDCETLGRSRLVQVDLWQKEADEDVTLATTLLNALDGYALTNVDQAPHGKLRGRDIQRLDDPVPAIVHHALTLSIAHAP